MMRRISLLAVAVMAFGWLMTGPVAAADVYPPTPVVTGAPTPGVSPGPSPVVVVREAPPAPRGALGRTGSSQTLPLVALATGAVFVGATLVGVARRRRSAA